MGIKEVTVSIGTTVNLGNYESIRLDVSLTADMTEDDFNFCEGLELADRARKELGYQLWDMAEAKLNTYGLADISESEREAYAREHCPEFRHMLMLHPDAAMELLQAVVEGAEMEDAGATSDLTSEEVDEALEDELGSSDDSDEEPDYDDEGIGLEDYDPDAEGEDVVAPQPTEGEYKKPDDIIGDIPF